MFLNNCKEFTKRAVLPIVFLLSTFLLISCADKKSPPLPGERINVLHYEIQNENTKNLHKFSLAKAQNNTSWSTSETGQFTALPVNIITGEKFVKITNFKPNKFSPRNLDNAEIIINGVFYSYTGGVLAAFDIQNKKSLWSVNLLSKHDAKNLLAGSIAYYNHVIYVSTGGKDLVAYQEDGKELWRYEAANIVRHIATINEKMIFFTSIDNKLSCLDHQGKLQWIFNGAFYSIATSKLYLPTVTHKDYVITTTTSGDLVLLNIHNGEELTQVNLATSALIGDGSLAKGPISSPVIINNNLYILNGENDFIKISLNSPEIIWRKNIPGIKSFWATDSVSFFLTDSQVIAIENNKGQIIWISNLPKSGKKQDKILDSYGPILLNGKLLITSVDGSFYLFSSENGSLLSSYKTNLKLKRSPMIIDGKLYFISSSGQIEVWQ